MWTTAIPYVRIPEVAMPASAVSKRLESLFLHVEDVPESVDYGASSRRSSRLRRPLVE
jgi:hypothetical protein